MLILTRTLWILLYIISIGIPRLTCFVIFFCALSETVLSMTFTLYFIRRASSSGGGGGVARVDAEEEEDGCSPSLRTSSCSTPRHAPAEVGFQSGRWRFILQELYFLCLVGSFWQLHIVNILRNSFATAYTHVFGTKLLEITVDWTICAYIVYTLWAKMYVALGHSYEHFVLEIYCFRSFYFMMSTMT